MTQLYVTRTEWRELQERLEDMEAEQSGTRSIATKAAARIGTLERSAEDAASKADGAVDDVRTFAEQLRDIEAKIDNPESGLVAIARMVKASAAHRVQLDARLSAGELRDQELKNRIEAEEQKYADAAKAGSDIALRREAKRRIVIGLTSLPVLLVIVTALARCAGG